MESALYPYSSIAPEYSSGLFLKYRSSTIFELMTISTISATFPISNTEYTSFLSISINITLYFLEDILLLEPALGHTYA